MKEDLKYRMMGLVPYNISPIQQGIQFGHAVVEYGLEHFGKPDYQEWANYNKTFIVLNGGTTNRSREWNEGFTGTLNNHKKWLEDNEIINSAFYEMDLGDQLTAVVFLVDERVFDNVNYPMFKEYLMEYKMTMLTAPLEDGADVNEDNTVITSTETEEELISSDSDIYRDYLEYIGGENNYRLKKWLTQFRLA